MSDIPQGPGWWQASDGRWYPPETHPSYAQPVATAEEAPEAGPPAEPEPAPEPAAAPENEPAPETAPARKRSARLFSERNVSTIVAVAIGVVTLTGAYLTWRSVNLSSSASSADSQAVIDTITLNKADAFAQSQLRFEEGYFARYRADLVAAEQFEKASAAATAQGQPDLAASLALQARSSRAAAASVLSSGVVPQAYLTGDTGQTVAFDEDRRERDLARSNPYVQGTPADPDATRAAADRYHDRSQRLIVIVVGLAGVILVLTLTQLARRSLQPWLATLAGAGFVVLTAVALLGDKP